MKDLSSVKIDQTGFVLAVSGGVDSMVLLDIVRKQISPVDYVVAHVNHGMRSSEETAQDEKVVREYCDQYELRLETAMLDLGSDASEETARDTRRAFYRQVKDKFDYNIVITAHHRDDVVETAIINMLRGTGAKGLGALRNTKEYHRPLLDYKKAQIYDYAKQNGISWHEDSTNQNEKYLRNYVRSVIVPKLDSAGGLDELERIVEEHKPRQSEFEEVIAEIEQSLLSGTGDTLIDRHLFIMLDHKIATEVVRRLFDGSKLKPPNRTVIEKIVVFMKTAKHGSSMDISKNGRLTVDPSNITLRLK